MAKGTYSETWILGLNLWNDGLQGEKAWFRVKGLFRAAIITSNHVLKGTDTQQVLHLADTHAFAMRIGALLVQRELRHGVGQMRVMVPATASTSLSGRRLRRARYQGRREGSFRDATRPIIKIVIKHFIMQAITLGFHQERPTYALKGSA